MSLFFAEPQERELRRQLHATLSGIVPPQHVDEVVDLAINAARQGIDALDRSVSVASSGQVALAAMGPALGILGNLCASHEACLKDYAKTEGMRSASGKIRL